MSVVALAGRRVNADDGRESGLPRRNIDIVRDRLRHELRALDVKTLIASAAAGSDLLGLEEAQHLGARTIVILPFDPSRFRTTSVEDRPDAKGWSALYDRILATSKVEILAQSFPLDSEAYAAVTRRIIERAIERAVELSQQNKAKALAVWDGQSRGSDDNSDYFIRYAREHGLRVVEVSTLA